MCFIACANLPHRKLLRKGSSKGKGKGSALFAEGEFLHCLVSVAFGNPVSPFKLQFARIHCFGCAVMVQTWGTRAYFNTLQVRDVVRALSAGKHNRRGMPHFHAIEGAWDSGYALANVDMTLKHLCECVKLGK